MIGWVAGVAAASYVSAVDHWIAFGLLAAVGTNMVYSASKGGLRKRPSPECPSLFSSLPRSEPARRHGGRCVACVLLGQYPGHAAAIGAAFLLSSGGMLIGRLIGERFGRTAEEWPAARLSHWAARSYTSTFLQREIGRYLATVERNQMHDNGPGGSQKCIVHDSCGFRSQSHELISRNFNAL